MRRGPRLATAALLLALLASASHAQSGGDAFEQARSLRRSGQALAAAELLAQALASGGPDERLTGLRGLCLLDAGRTADARALAQQWQGYAGREPRLHTFLGRIAQSSGDGELAAAAFRRALQCDASFVEASIGLVQTALAAGQLGVAVEEAAHLEQLEPELGRRLGAEVLVAQAQKLQRAGDEQGGRAIEKYRAALAKRPDDRLIARGLLECLVQFIHVEEARALAAQTYAAAADAAERHYWEARCRDALMDLPGAQAEYLATLAADPAHVGALLELARLAVEDGRHEEARERLAAAAAAGPLSARSCLLLGLAEECLGHDEAAERSLREALRLDGDNTKALYHLGRLLTRTGRAEEGHALLERVKASHP